VAIVGYVSVTSGDDSKSGDEPNTSLFGVILLLVSQCFTGCLFISEEVFLSGYYLDPFLVVGLEGMWGSLIFAILLPIFQQVHCEGELCSQGYLENSAKAFHELIEYPSALYCSIFIILSIALFNATGVAITKYASAAQRSTIDTSRTLLIWMVSLALGWEDFLPWELLGFVFLVIGTFIYNEIVVVPIGFMAFNTKIEMAKREGKSTPDGADYMSSSPAAAYDNSRNKRNIAAAQGGADDRARLVDKHNENEEIYMHNGANPSHDPSEGRSTGK
jgi:hypothetical protein